MAKHKIFINLADFTIKAIVASTINLNYKKDAATLGSTLT